MKNGGKRTFLVYRSWKSRNLAVAVSGARLLTKEQFHSAGRLPLHHGRATTLGCASSVTGEGQDLPVAFLRLRAVAARVLGILGAPALASPLLRQTENRAEGDGVAVVAANQAHHAKKSSQAMGSTTSRYLSR